METLLLGPLLGLESEMDYTVCFVTANSVDSASVIFADTEIEASNLEGLQKGKFWRAEYRATPPSSTQTRSYSIKSGDAFLSDRHGRNSWSFHIPARDESPRIAYASCNGFSSPDLMSKSSDPFLMWKLMKASHEKDPFSLLIMGGDQVYADEIWTSVSELAKWTELKLEKRRDRKPTHKMKHQLRVFYEQLYQGRWNSSEMSEMLACIPSAMMWDDHDIFDGWGSHPESINHCPVHLGIFEEARRCFELFQVRSIRNKSLLCKDRSHYTFGFRFRDMYILGLDNRSRRTRNQIMDNKQWSELTLHLEKIDTVDNLLILTAIPVVYRDFSAAEILLDATSWEEELTDDLKDHWRSRQHEGERARLIMNLLDSVRRRGATSRTVVLSGDVHVGCAGIINDWRAPEKYRVHQLVSSGIVHPAPSRIQWLGISAATNDEVEYLNEEGTIEIKMLKPFGSKKYIRSRNFLSIKLGSDKKLWATWICENNTRPELPLM